MTIPEGNFSFNNSIGFFTGTGTSGLSSGPMTVMISGGSFSFSNNSYGFVVNVGSGGTGTVTTNISGGNLSFDHSYGFYSDYGSVITNISGGNLSFSNGSYGFYNDNGGSGPVTTVISGGNLSFTGAGTYGFYNTGFVSAPLTTTISGGNLSFTGGSTGFYCDTTTAPAITNISGGSLSFTGASTLGFWNDGGTMTNTISGGTLLFDGVTAALATTLDFSTGNGTFASGVNGTTFGGTDPNGASQIAELTLGSAATHQAWIASSGGTPTSLPVQMVTPVTVPGTSTANLGGAILDVVNSQFSITQSNNNVAGQTFTIVEADLGSTIIGTYGTLTSSSLLKYGFPVYSTIPGVGQIVTITTSTDQSFGGYVGSNATGNEVAMAQYLDTVPLATLQSSPAIVALNTLILNGNISGYQNALNQIQPSQLNAQSGMSLNSMVAVTQIGHTNMQAGRMQKEASSALSASSFDLKRQTAFSSLITNHTMNALNAKNLLQSSGAPQRKGVLSQVKPSGFTNSPEAINRHQPQAGRIQVGKANVWVQPYGQLVSQRGNVNAPGLNSQLGGIALGADYEVTPDTIFGILGGTSTSPFQWYQNRGNGKMNSGYGGLYVGWKDSSGFYMEGQTIFGGNKFTTNRNIIFPGVNQTASASHNAFQFTGNLEIGYALPIYDWFTAQPFILADYLVMRERGYTETGAGLLNMSIDPKTSQLIQPEIGIAAYKTFTIGETLLRPTAELGWVQRQPISNGKVTGGFAGQQPSLVVTGLNKVYNQFAPGLGLIAQFKNGLYISANAYAQVGDGLNIGEALIRVGYEF